MFKLDMWMASPSAYANLSATDICCKGCTGKNTDGFYSKFCKVCKWKDNPITIEEIENTRRKY